MIQKEGYRVNSRRLTKIFFHELHFESFLQGLELTCSALEMVNGIEQADTTGSYTCAHTVCLVNLDVLKTLSTTRKSAADGVCSVCAPKFW